MGVYGDELGGVKLGREERRCTDKYLGNKCCQLSQPPNDQFQGEEGGAGRGSNVESVKIRSNSLKVKEKHKDREGADQ